MARKRTDESPATDLNVILSPPAREAQKAADIPRDDELSEVAWNDVIAALPGEPPPWLRNWLCVQVWSARSGRIGAGGGDALDDELREALTAIEKMSGGLHEAVLALPFDLQDCIEEQIRDSMPPMMRGRYSGDPMEIVAMLPYLQAATRSKRDESLRAKQSKARRVSNKATVSALMCALDEAADRIELEMGEKLNRGKFFTAVRHSLPTGLRAHFPIEYSAQRKRVRRRPTRTSGQ